MLNDSSKFAEVVVVDLEEVAPNGLAEGPGFDPVHLGERSVDWG